MQINGTKVWEMCSPTTASVPHLHGALAAGEAAAINSDPASMGALAMAHELYYRGRWQNERVARAYHLREQQLSSEQNADRPDPAAAAKADPKLKAPGFAAGGCALPVG